MPAVSATRISCWKFLFYDVIKYHVSSLVQWFVSRLALLATLYVVCGSKIRSFSLALVAAELVEFSNIMIQPILLVLVFPLNILTLGFFYFCN